jgi:hypothetical protein
MLVYRVFLEDARAHPGEPGSPTYFSNSGGGRWDNRSLYQLAYVASAPEAAIGETFANRSHWEPGMFIGPGRTVRRLATYRFDETTHPTIDLDDAVVLAARTIRPSRVVRKNRPATQALAQTIYREGSWAGISWWSSLWPDWPVHAIWATGALEPVRVEDIPGHPGYAEAARTLVRSITA